MTDLLTVYINQHEFCSMSFFEYFVTCNVIKIAWVANMNNFSVTLRYFTLTATCVAMCLKNKTFLYMTHRHFSSFNYWKKCGESVSLLVHFVFFTVFLIYFLMTKLVYLIVSFYHMILRPLNQIYLCLFFVVYIPAIIAYHSHLFLNFIPKPVDRHSRLIYEANLFNNNFNKFNKFFTILKCSVDLGFEFNVTADSSRIAIFM